MDTIEIVQKILNILKKLDQSKRESVLNAVLALIETK